VASCGICGIVAAMPQNCHKSNFIKSWLSNDYKLCGKKSGVARHTRVKIILKHKKK
jgi:hypothetical protein